jgi:MYXO-CTERM domain-containing protein
MPSYKLLSVVRGALCLLCAMVLTSWAGDAAAAGTIKWKTKNLKEKDKTYWLIDLEVHMPKPPDVAHVPMKFEFEQTAYYARDLVDGDKIVERKIPMTNKMPMIESVDVGFLDPGSGKVERRTKFSFKVNRSQGYEAGEYKVTVTDARNGSKVGAPTTLTFEGQNEVVDRRAMVFSGQKKKEDAKPKEDTTSGNTQKIDLNDVDTEAGGEGEKGKSKESGGGSSEPGSMNSGSDESLADDDEPQTIEEKPGGCGCRVQGSGGSDARLLLLAAVAALLVLRRRSS